MNLQNLQKTLDKYGLKISTDMASVVGVKTGALRDSITYYTTNNQLIIKMLDYGQYLNPWKKSGVFYRDIVEEEFENMYDEIGNSYAKDIVIELETSVSQNKYFKIWH